MGTKSQTKKIFKLITINLTVLGVLLVAPALLYRIYLFAKPKLVSASNGTTDARAFYPTYSDKDFSVKLLNEFANLPTEYKSFIGWRRNKVDLKYTKIGGPYHARKSNGEAIDDSVWFFGGSTMWGSGASDSQTIPSHFNAITSLPVYNFGETGWNSRQSLNQLLNTLGDNHKPSSVIFYDGVNDVITQCRSDIKYLPADEYQTNLQELLTKRTFLSKVSKFIYTPVSKFIYAPYKAIFAKLNLFTSSSSLKASAYNCDTNKSKAQSVAEHLINNWHAAFLLSKSNNIQFYGILQPTLFTTDTNSDYLIIQEKKRILEFEKQYNTVYPLILEKIEEECAKNQDFCDSIINGTDWLDGNNNIFIDFCHLNSSGNKIIAKRISDLQKR